MKTVGFVQKDLSNGDVHCIVFVWSQYDGGNIDKEQLAEVPSKTLRSQAEYYVRRLILDPNNKILIQPFTMGLRIYSYCVVAKECNFVGKSARKIIVPPRESELSCST